MDLMMAAHFLLEDNSHRSASLSKKYASCSCLAALLVLLCSSAGLPVSGAPKQIMQERKTSPQGNRLLLLLFFFSEHKTTVTQTVVYRRRIKTEGVLSRMLTVYWVFVYFIFTKCSSLAQQKSISDCFLFYLSLGEKTFLLTVAWLLSETRLWKVKCCVWPAVIRQLTKTIVNNNHFLLTPNMSYIFCR